MTIRRLDDGGGWYDTGDRLDAKNLKKHKYAWTTENFGLTETDGMTIANNEISHL